MLHSAPVVKNTVLAHGEHEERSGQREDNWPEWYAAYTVAEQAGKELRTETSMT